MEILVVENVKLVKERVVVAIAAGNASDWWADE